MLGYRKLKITGYRLEIAGYKLEIAGYKFEVAGYEFVWEHRGCCKARGLDLEDGVRVIFDAVERRINGVGSTLLRMKLFGFWLVSPPKHMLVGWLDNNLDRHFFSYLTHQITRPPRFMQR